MLIIANFFMLLAIFIKFLIKPVDLHALTLYKYIQVFNEENAMATVNNPGTDEKTEAFTSFKMPNVDMNAIMDSYKKNLEILGLINKMSLEVCNGVTKLQSAFIKQMVADMGSIMEKGTKPAEAMARCSEVFRDSTVKAFGNCKQISDMMMTMGNELTAAVAKRMKESVEEAKSIVNSKN